ncbi:MAG: hypothetical protein FIA92_09225 [Chloroflexi bacterium]|nr:hypothetical protein [Chloroflexota bacterium]
MSRRSVRYAAAFIATAMAAIYVLIGLDILQVVEDQAVGTDLFGFGMSAAALFAFGALLLVASDRRSLWVLGAILQVAVAVLYVAVSVNRHPPFEFWGVALRLLQVPLFLALVVLAVQPRTEASVVASQIRIGRG